MMTNARQDNTENLHSFIEKIFTKSLRKQLSETDDIYFTTISDIGSRFKKYHDQSDGMDYLRERSGDRKNIFHVLFGWDINKVVLDGIDKKTLANKKQHVFYYSDIKIALEKWTSKKKINGSITTVQLKIFFDSLIKEKVSYYF